MIPSVFDFSCPFTVSSEVWVDTGCYKTSKPMFKSRI